MALYEIATTWRRAQASRPDSPRAPQRLADTARRLAAGTRLPESGMMAVLGYQA